MNKNEPTSVNHVINYMRKQGIEVNRKNFVTLNTLGDENGEDMLDAENEAELREELQHPDFKGDETNVRR